MEKNEGVDGLKSVAEIELTQDDQGADTTNWSEVGKELYERGKQWEGVAKRNHSDILKIRKEFEELKRDPRLLKAEDPPKPPQNTGFDYGQMALLEVRGIPEEDHDFLLEEVKTTGKELKDVLNFKYVQEELKNRKDKRTVETALPSGSKRSSGAARDSTDYWLAKGEMPDRAQNPELYRKVRKERERLELMGGRPAPASVVSSARR